MSMLESPGASVLCNFKMSSLHVRERNTTAVVGGVENISAHVAGEKSDHTIELNEKFGRVKGVALFKTFL